MVRRRKPDPMSEVKDKLVIQLKSEVRGLAEDLPPGVYIDFCEEMEYFFSEEAERTRELMEQSESGLPTIPPSSKKRG